MFKITGDFSNGAYSGGKINGFQVMAMQSQEYTDKLIAQFEKAIAAGYNPNTVSDDVFNKVGCRESDLTEFDKNRLKKKVEALWKAHHSYR